MIGWGSMGLRERILRSNKIFIFPNRYGFLYLVVIAVMILSGAAYSNNLIYLLGFFLFSVFVASMVQTHNNIKGIRVTVSLVEDGFQGDFITVHLRMQNLSSQVRQNLRVVPEDKRIRTEIPAKIDFLRLGEVKNCSLQIKALKRGVYRLPRMEVYTNYPMGLFIAWKFEMDPVEYFVYPAIKQGLRSPSSSTDNQSRIQRLASLSREDGDFKEHKPYVEGESYRHIDWKAYARKRPLLLKKFESEAGEAKSFRYSDLRDLSVEQRLSHLAGWIQRARVSGESFELVLPQQRLPVDSGLRHVKTSLRLLATYKEA